MATREDKRLPVDESGEKMNSIESRGGAEIPQTRTAQDELIGRFDSTDRSSPNNPESESGDSPLGIGAVIFSFSVGFLPFEFKRGTEGVILSPRLSFSFGAVNNRSTE